MTSSIFRAPSEAAVEAAAKVLHEQRESTLPEAVRIDWADAGQEWRREDATAALTAAHAITVREVVEACAAMFDRREREAMADMEKNHVGSVERTLDTEKAVGWGRAARALRALLPDAPKGGDE